VTREELLAKIDKLETFDERLEMTEAFRAVKILRAVVELHKPEMMISSSYCVECTINLETIIYPCPTIQAIEKELVNG
jgi:hypothetical protein